MDFGHDGLELSGPLHAQKVAFVFDVGHGDSELRSVVVVVGLHALVVEVVGGAGGVASKFAEVGGVALVLLLSQAEIVVAADAAALVFAEEDGPLVLPDHLVVLAEAALVPLEVDERMPLLLQRHVDGHFALLLV